MSQQKLGFWLLTALVVGNMVGSGIFMLPRSLSESASPAGVTLAWLLTGAGVMLTALVFGNLAIRKPELSGGPQIYAKELLKEKPVASLLSGFMSSWGYWIGNFAGNVAIISTFTSYLSTFFPILNSKAVIWTIGSFDLKVGNALTFIICTLMLWGAHFIILKGMKGAGKINFVATVAKVIGFALFIILALFAFDKSNILPFVAPKEDAAGHTVGLLSQVNGAALSTLWAFIGIESAVVFASRAKRTRDVKWATIVGLCIALAIYLGISFLTMGVLSQSELIHSEKPLVDATEQIVGPIGAYLIAGLGLVSLLGSTIGWVLLSAEVPYQAARQGLFLPAFAKENKQSMPVFSLWVSNALAQLFIFSTVSSSISSAFDFVIYIATLAYLVPYLISALYQMRLTITGETYLHSRQRVVDGMIAAGATIYSLWVIVAGTSDLKTFLFGVALLASGIIFYPLLRKNAHHLSS
ncbi:amino acid permease [Priestia koreensis]|uniref:Arginine:ornithine antiporter n=1 Tax=Priestia koreensis TaxID=284581 RepID=A0A0M0L5D3_9BACI|nr:amino acid permease [Priestia koreensis]KOO46290.1 arginine:ornithine antiporter [Priestia koreensis]MCM3004370.1 amino acid permease [Priestia koreensis]